MPDRINVQKGLRQGDPLSPYICDLYRTAIQLLGYDLITILKQQAKINDTSPILMSSVLHKRKHREILRYMFILTSY